MADALEGHTHRMSPVAQVDWTSLDRTVAELERMRARGSRAFWMRAAPLEGIGLGNPRLDRLWSAATDLGMVAIVHVGNAPVNFDGGWANMGWELPGGAEIGGFFRYANALRHQPAEMAVASMVYGGVFGRHPNLTVLTEEFLIGWLPFFVRRCDALGDGSWPFDLSPGEMIRRNVRATPLPGWAMRTSLRRWSSSPRCWCSPPTTRTARATPPRLRSTSPSSPTSTGRSTPQFFGENMVECFRRMGDPLPVAG